MGNIPSSGGSSIDLSQVQMVIAKLQSELKFKANQSDVDSLKDAVGTKADKSQMKNSAMSKEIDRIGQFVEMLSKTMQTIRNQPTAAPVQQSGVDEGVIRDILNRLEALENGVRSLDS
jgi:archaellin